MSDVDKAWFESSFNSQKIEVETDFIKPKNKRSKVEEIMIDFYKEFASVVEPNHFDEWINTQSELYNQFWRLPEIFIEMGNKVGILDHEMLYEGKEGISEILFQICSAYIKNNEVKKTIREFINEKFNNIIEVKRHYIQMEMTDILNAEILQNITIAKETDIQKMAKRLDEVVYIGTESWECILYSALSVSAPDVMINGVVQRGNCHTNLIGEISTAKSKILNVLKKIVPKWINVTKSTEASFEGVSKMTEIQAGLIERAKDGSFLIPEFKRSISKFQLLREAMDCDEIEISKRGITRKFKVNTSFIAASNPVKDFFPIMGRMRDSIPFDEGIMSRFDFVIPFLSTEERNKEILQRLELFGGEIKEEEFDKMKTVLRTLTEGMKVIKGIVITPEQEALIKDAYLRNNVKIEGGLRPLVILRDLETLCRLVNVIVSTNFYNRIPSNRKGYFEALDVDIEKAIDLWENLLFLRKQMYDVRSDKNLMFADEAILHIISAYSGEMHSKKLFEAMINIDLANSERSCSRRIKRLVENKILKMERKTNPDGTYEGTYYTIEEGVLT